MAAQAKRAETKSKEMKLRQAAAIERKKELKECFGDQDTGSLALITQLIDQVVYLEGELDKLCKLPMLVFDRVNPAIQKQTPAAHFYTRLVSRYADIIHKLTKLKGDAGETEDSPLRAYLRGIIDEQ